MRLKDKVCIITGAGAGIGRAASLLFAREGAALMCSDLNPETTQETVNAVRAAGGTAEFFQADAASAADVEKLVAATVERYGRLNVFYANAGIVPGGTVTECPEDVWDQAMTVNVKSVFMACKYGIPAMLAQGGGTFVVTASVAGLVGVKNRAAYSASKAGVVGLVKSVALDYIQDGIRINAICPGTVDTPSLQGRLRATGDYEKALRDFIARQPMGRIGNAEEIAALALYLASDESGYMTGSHLMIDGGLSL